MVQIEPIQDSNRDFLGRFCSYVLRFGEMELAHTIIRVLEGSEVEISHKHILTYKKEVTTPEDFELASEEIRLYYLSGSSTVISPALLKSLKEFIQYQMLYVETHQEIEPEMLEYFQGDVTDDGYDLTTEE